jgi:mannose-1-phosphate guanylyltransferase
MKTNCYSVIIAGGKGTRFWPLSRAQRPKQLLKILSRRSLIDETAERVLSLGGRDKTLVVTVAEQVQAMRKNCALCPWQFYRRAARQEHRAMHRLGGPGNRPA